MLLSCIACYWSLFSNIMQEPPADRSLGGLLRRNKDTEHAIHRYTPFGLSINAAFIAVPVGQSPFSVHILLRFRILCWYAACCLAISHFVNKEYNAGVNGRDTSRYTVMSQTDQINKTWCKLFIAGENTNNSLNILCYTYVAYGSYDIDKTSNWKYHNIYL